MSKLGMWVAAVALAVTGAAGCVAEGDDEGPRIELGTAELSADLAHILVSPKPSMMGLGESAPAAQIPEDPCDCTTPECLHDWVELNLGCDVCLTFVCDGEPTAHACAACTGDAAGPGPGGESPDLQ
jgi:hypothetical protein